MINMYVVPKNLVFVSGCHGSGKDYLINQYFDWYEKHKVELDYKAIRYNKCEMTSFTNIYERQIRRIAKYAIDFRRILTLCTRNPDYVVVTDRCPVLDPYCYINAFYRLEYIDNEVKDHLLRILDDTFSFWDKKEIMKRVFLLIDYDDNILEKIKKRDANKWNEDDDRYTKAVAAEYRILSSDDVGKEVNMLYDSDVLEKFKQFVRSSFNNTIIYHPYADVKGM